MQTGIYRKSSLLVLALAAAGCQNQVSSLSSPVVTSQPRSIDFVNATPIKVDSAMESRTWGKTPAAYPNLSTTTGSARFALVPDHNLDGNVRAGLGIPVFVVNTLLLPVYFIATPPLTKVESTSLYLPPSATGNPPITPVDRTDFSGGPLGSAYTTASGRSSVEHVH